MLQKWLLFVLLISMINEIQPKNGDNQQPSPNNQILSQTGNDNTQQSPAQQPEPQPPPPPPPPPTSSKPCDSIEDGSSFAIFGKCDIEEYPYFGHSMQFVRLDFSATTGNQITTFFGKATKEATLSAAFRLVNNNKVTNIDLGMIKRWKAEKLPEGEVFIEIVNNVNLVTFLFKKMEFFDVGKPVKVLIYNNPMLEWEKHEKDLITGKMTADSFFETKRDACTFQNPQDKTQSIKPTPDLLPKCKIFRGDLKLESVSLSGDITFTDGCLHLVGVNMKNVTKITAEAGKGHENCKLAGVKPIIEKNPGLCGDKMAAVAAYMPKVESKLDDTCTVICKDQDKVNDKFYRCAKIEADFIDFELWFEPGYERIADKLTEAKDISIKDRGNVEKIDFPVLKTVNYLEISGNSALKTLELKALIQAKRLTIKNNQQLTLKEIKKLSKDLKKGPDSEIECIATKSTIVTDIEALRHCTKIIGPMLIRNAKNDVDPANFNIKEVTDCLTIEDTKLTNLRFLENAKFGCTEKHKLKKNIHLCKPEFLGKDGAAIEQIDGKTNDCGKKCTSLTEKNCVIFEGDLTVDDLTLSADLAALEVIEGKLTITSGPRNLEFPALTYIVNSKAPAFLITNNPKLESIKMPKLERIGAGGEQPAVKIENSPKLKNLKDFLPAKIAETCSRSASTSCQYDRAEKEENWFKENIPLLAAIIAGDVVFGAAAGIGVFLYKRYKKKKKSKAKTRKSGHLWRFSVNIILFLGQLEVAISVIFFEQRDLNDNYDSAFSLIFISTAGAFIILCLASVIMDGYLFIINKKRHKHNVRPTKLTSIKTALQTLKLFLVMINLVTIFLWHEYHGILSLDMSQTTAETLKKRQNLEVTVVKSTIIALLELIVLVFVETHLLSCGLGIGRRTQRRKKRRKERNTRKTAKRIK